MSSAQPPLSVDAQVQQTNDDSIVSKRSAGKCGYVVDDFLRHFVKKLTRRTPLINRGYYLRLVAMSDVVAASVANVLSKQEEEKEEDKEAQISGDQLGSRGVPPDGAQWRLPSVAAQVLSLGAGFDTFAMRNYTTWSSRVQFFEVDFPSVIRNKALLMQKAGLQHFPFLNCLVDTEKGEVHATRFHSIGLDLRDSEPLLLPRLKELGFDPLLPTIVYCECVTQYMSVECSNDVCSWISRHLPNGVYYSYDQIRPSDSFGQVMLGALRSRCSPLVGVASLSDGQALARRALRCAFSFARTANFFDISSHVLRGAELQRVQALESFDEHEEWAEMCDHYVIVGAASVDSMFPGAQECPYLRRFTLNEEDLESPLSTPADGFMPLFLETWPSGRCSIDGWGSSVAMAMAGGTPFFASYGGYQAGKGLARSCDLAIHSLRDGDVSAVTVPGSTVPPSTTCHTLLSVGNGVLWLFGGRTNPGTCFGDVFLGHLGLSSFPENVTIRWSPLLLVNPVEDVLPCPRSRHCAVFLPSLQAVLLVGGQSSTGSMLGDAWLLFLDVPSGSGSWTQLNVTGDAFPAVASAAGCLLREGREANDDSCVVLLSGGLGEGGECNGDIGVLVISAERKGVDGDRHRFVTCTFKRRRGALLGRFSHAMTTVTLDGGVLGVLVIGGAANRPKGRQGTMNHATVVMTSKDPTWADPSALVLRECSAATTGSESSSLTTAAVCCLQLPCTVIRSTAVEVATGVVAVIGGGFTAFSFGNAFVKPFLLHCSPLRRTRELFAPVTPSSERDEVLPSVTHGLGHSHDSSKPITQERPVKSASFVFPSGLRIPFENSVWETSRRELLPALFTSVPMGTCIERWSDKEYLKSRLGSAEVLVHVAPRSHYLDFIHKNFTLKRTSFAELLDHVFPSSPPLQEGNGNGEVAHGDLRSAPSEETWYLRSVGMTSRSSDYAHFFRDFHSIACDLQLPESIQSVVMPRHQQSVLRVNQKQMQLWTHYDTLDNVLFHIVGIKRVIVFPPSQYTNLYMEGSSSRVVNIDDPDLDRFPRFSDARKHAVEYLLRPGDMLVIPAMWLHHVTAVDACISVNIFYETLPKGSYDPKDMYGNKDLPAAVAARTELVKLAKKSFFDASRLPAPHDEFALRQAIAELEALADHVALSRRPQR